MSLLNFDSFCQQVSLPVCSLIGNKVEPLCYSRNIELIKDQLVFQPGKPRGVLTGDDLDLRGISFSTAVLVQPLFSST